MSRRHIRLTFEEEEFEAIARRAEETCRTRPNYIMYCIFKTIRDEDREAEILKKYRY